MAAVGMAAGGIWNRPPDVKPTPVQVKPQTPQAPEPPQPPKPPAAPQTSTNTTGAAPAPVQPPPAPAPQTSTQWGKNALGMEVPGYSQEGLDANLRQSQQQWKAMFPDQPLPEALGGPKQAPQPAQTSITPPSPAQPPAPPAPSPTQPMDAMSAIVMPGMDSAAGWAAGPSNSSLSVGLGQRQAQQPMSAAMSALRGKLY